MQSKMFDKYTGNAMLNNALMTIESLAGLDSVTKITPSVLTELYSKLGLKEINKRLKSYTMVFSLNNPLVNPAKKTNNVGEITYHNLLSAIMSNFEADGDKICEVSGLKFNKTFEEFYREELERQKTKLVKESIDEKQLKKELKNIDNTDTSINRSWFPLIGGLGSDAQALPQAKFAVQIHPICIPILQFLPLSSLLYKGGVLLIDSSNFELSREMVDANTKILSNKIQSVSVKDAVENVRDFAKGDYIIKILDILLEKEEFEETYSDINMWSFSNSGTGASCNIDRIPNITIRKLERIYKNAKTGGELKKILSRGESAYSFIEAFEANKDWFLLYPNIFGIGKKRMKYKGVSPDFLEVYYKEIGKENFIPIAKYLAGLIVKYKSNTFEKILEKTDAWNNPEYRIELYKVLIKATEENEWNLKLHISILDDKDKLPVENSFYQLHKLIHFFTLNNIVSSELPKIDETESKILKICKWIISLIQSDLKASSIISNLTNPVEYSKVGYNRIIFDALEFEDIAIENVIEVFYDEYYNFKKYNLNELLRIFFSQKKQEIFDFKSWESKLREDLLLQNWIRRIQSFVNDYQSYYFAKYQNIETGGVPYKKFNRTIESMIVKNNDFNLLLDEAIFNTNQFIKEVEQRKDDKWSIDDLMTNPLANNNRNICIMTVKFLLKQTAIKFSKEKTIK